MNEMKSWGDCVKIYVADLRAQFDAKIKLANTTLRNTTPASRYCRKNSGLPKRSEPPPGNAIRLPNQGETLVSILVPPRTRATR